ncbi:MAG: APC family permease [Culicoidibacterales bacterium]
MEKNLTTGLKKSISLWGAMSLVIGTVIGSGIYSVPASVLASTGTPTNALFAWLVGGIITIFSALTVAEIATIFSTDGGIVTYMREAYGKMASALTTWVFAIIYYPAILAVLAIVAGDYTRALFNLPAELNGFPINVLIGMGAILFILLVNILSTKLSSQFQIVASFAKLLPIIALSIAGIAFAFQNDTAVNFTQIASGATPLTVATFGTAVASTLFAYEGWIGVGAIAGEMKNPQRDLMRSIVIGVFIVIIAYVLMNLTYFFSMSPDQILASEALGSDVATLLLGSTGSRLVTLAIAISLFGSLNAYSMIASRFFLQAAKDREIPCSRFLDKVHPKTATPIRALLVVVILSFIFIFSNSFNFLLDIIVTASWIIYAAIIFAVFRFRKTHSHIERSFKVPFYPVVPALAFVSAIYIIASKFIPSIMSLTTSQPDYTAIITFIIFALGIVMYVPVSRYYINDKK